MTDTVLEKLRALAVEEWRRRGLLEERVDIAARVLSPEEAIGNPEGGGFKLQTGRERMMQADFQGAKGQAFTDEFGDFHGALADIAALPLDGNYRRAVFVSALNATFRGLGLCDRTIHCRDEGPAQCAVKLREHMQEKYPGARITQVGLQPKFVGQLAPSFPLRVLDLDADNIGKQVAGALIEGPEATRDAVDWADVLLVTGSAVCNDSLGLFLAGKPLVVFGVSGAAAAGLLGLDRFCASSE